MDSSWSSFVADPAPAGHAVQIYDDPAQLADAVAAYVAAGFDSGEPALIVANHRHWGVFTEGLERRGWDLARIQKHPRLLRPLDAHATLDALLVDGTPSRERFTQIVGSLLDDAEQAFPGKRVRVFGEMVDILAADGRRDAAAALEQLWNELLKTRDFSLLCGYHLDVFDRDAQVAMMPHVCHSHSHVRVTDDPERLDRAVDAALEEVVGPEQAGRVYALAASGAGPARTPLAELALMWLSAELPALAERVLASARAHYLRDAASSAAV